MEASGKAHSRKEGNHDGCGDCIRQKKENEAFIKIYERLQEVERRASLVRQAVSQHKTGSDTNRSFYHKYEQKLLNLPKMKDREVSTQAITSAGYEIAASLLEREAKSRLVAENQKLKEVLHKMQKEKYQAATRDARFQSNMLLNDSSLKLRDSLSQSFNSQLSTHGSPSRGDRKRSQLEKLTNSQDSSESCQQSGSTQSSSFTATKLRKSMDLSKYNDLNLWLYQSEKNSKLEEQLFVARAGERARRAGSVLPSIRK